MERLFQECDLLSEGSGNDKAFSILFNHPPTERFVQRQAPSYIDNPFSEEFSIGLSSPARVFVNNRFCAQIREAVLYGERAIVTKNNRLITDCRRPSDRPIFSAGTRSFEKMEPTIESGDLLKSERVDNPRIEINRTVSMLSSSEHWNYGAVLLRQIPKILILKKLGLEAIPILAPASGWQKSLLGVFGIENIIEHDRETSYVFSNLIVPSQIADTFFLPNDVVELFKNVAETAQQRFPNSKAELLYVSRLNQGKVNPSYRRCVNEEELILALENLGFLIIEPEKYSIEEQIAFFSSAKFVVGPSGAGMFNTIFSRPGTHVLSVEPLPHWIWQHCNIFASMRHQFGLVTGGAIPDDPEPVQKSWLADVVAITARVKMILKKIKF